jgi:Na+-transporting methylmalonyl-CoA/oxaloacetate decarboxylase gamma subunit
MEKLKCSSCGGELEVEENKEYAKCKYCGARYKLNEDLNVNIKLDDNMKEVLNNGLGTVKHASKIILIPIILFLFIFIVIFVFGFISTSKSRQAAEERQREMQEQSNQRQEEIQEQIKQAKEKAETEEKEWKEQINKSQFNFDFEYESGTKNAFFLKSTFDKIVRSNKTNDRKISLVFNGTETTEESEIINIKQSLDGNYEVSINYDDTGYINKIIVDKIN